MQLQRTPVSCVQTSKPKNAAVCGPQSPHRSLGCTPSMQLQYPADLATRSTPLLGFAHPAWPEQLLPCCTAKACWKKGAANSQAQSEQAIVYSMAPFETKRYPACRMFSAARDPTCKDIPHMHRGYKCCAYHKTLPCPGPRTAGPTRSRY